MPPHVSLDKLAARRASTGTLAAAGFGGAHRLNTCGYGLGTTSAPNRMDGPMVYRDDPAVVAPGATFHATKDGCERLGRMPLVLDLGGGA